MTDEPDSETLMQNVGEIMDAAMAQEAVEENSDGRLLNLDTAEYIVYAEVGMVELLNDAGQSGIYTTVTLTHASLDNLLDEDSYKESTFILGSIASLTLLSQQLQSALGYASDPTPAQENN